MFQKFINVVLCVVKRKMSKIVQHPTDLNNIPILKGKYEVLS